MKTRDEETAAACDLLIPLKGRVEVNTGEECLPAVDGYADFTSSSPHVVGSSTFTRECEYSRAVPMKAALAGFPGNGVRKA